MEEKLKHNFTAIPTNLTIILDINCRSMLFTLCQLASYYADKEGWFFRTNADLAEESKLSQKLVIAVIDTLYSNGIIDVKSVGKGKGKHSNYYRLNFKKFIEYEKYTMDELKNPKLHINTVEGYNKKGYSPSYLNDSPKESPIIPQITNNKDNIEINPETHETKEVTKYKYDTYEVKLNKYDRDSLINALIGTKYSISDQIALNRHMVNNDTQYTDEWKKFDSFCEKCKKIIDGK